MAGIVKYMVTLYHAIDGEQEFYPVDAGNALRHPEWKRAPWTKAENDAYAAGVAAYEATLPKPDAAPQTPGQVIATDKARAAFNLSITKAGPKAEAEATS